MKMTKKKKKSKVEAEATQKKQCFSVEDVHVRIMVMPWKVTSETGTPNCSWMEALVYKDNGLCVRGISVCNPIDEFDFRVGAELALRDAFKVEVNHFKYPNVKLLKFSVADLHIGKRAWKKESKEILDGGHLYSYMPTFIREKAVEYETRKKIWNEFNRLLPK